MAALSALMQAVEYYMAAEHHLRQAEQTFREAKIAVVRELDGREDVIIPTLDVAVRYPEIQRMKLDEQRLYEVYPQLFRDFSRKTIERVLSVQRLSTQPSAMARIAIVP